MMIGLDYVDILERYWEAQDRYSAFSRSNPDWDRRAEDTLEMERLMADVSRYNNEQPCTVSGLVVDKDIYRYKAGRTVIKLRSSRSPTVPKQIEVCAHEDENGYSITSLVRGARIGEAIRLPGTTHSQIFFLKKPGITRFWTQLRHEVYGR